MPRPRIADVDLESELDVVPTSLGSPAPESARHAGATRVYDRGSVIGRKYQLQQLIGEGGMGSVWVAKNLTLDIDVAVKVMRADLADEVGGVAERMLQEARAAASVGHPAIVQVFDFGFTESGDPYIVMEVLNGESLHSAMRRRGRVKPTRAAQTLLPILDALAATHARGIVHRDLKPENIFLARPPGQHLQPKVLDFGIAKLEQRVAERLTRSGAVIGSPAYMAPEQLGAESIDARADVWSLGVVLYEMITTRRPFEGASYHASLSKVLNAPPTPIAEHGVDEPALWRIIERALAKDPQQRYATMREFGRALAEWLLERGVQEDVCDASLRVWLVDERLSAPALNSFFPSMAPERPSGAVLLIPAPAHPLGVAAPRAGRRDPVVVDPTPRPSRASRLDSGARFRWWVPVSVLAAAACFLVVAFWYGQRNRSDAVHVTPPAWSEGLVATSESVEEDESSAQIQEQAELTAAARAQKLPPLPPSDLKWKPLPRTGAQAPVLYVDEPSGPDAP